MNKQELIDKWESKTGAPSYEISDFPINPSKNEMYIAGYGVARTEILKDLKQLDEPQKPVVPQLVAEWFEDNKYNLDNYIWDYIREWEDQDHNSELFEWFGESNNPIETLIRMKDGYEVEKEPKYYLILPHITKMTHGHATKIHNISTGVTKDLAYDIFSEEEIKEIDERYWPFAVPVEEVTER